MTIGDTVFTRDDSFISRAIRKLTKSEYSHVGLVIGEQLILESYGFAGTRITNLKTFETRGSREVVKTYSLPIKLARTQRRVIRAEASTMLGTPYDFEQAFGIFLRVAFGFRRANLFNRINHYICSEVIDRLFSKADIPRHSNKALGDLVPDELIEIYRLIPKNMYTL